MSAPYELTDEDKKNGWDEISAARYHAERAAAHARLVLHRPKPRPQWANSKYSPFRIWRNQ